MLSLLLLLSPVDAAELPLWAEVSFPEAPVKGNDGWTGGFGEDDWMSNDDRNQLWPATDYNNGDYGGRAYGSGWAADNWLIKGPSFHEGVASAVVGNRDDDCAGVVANHNGDDTFYLFALTSGSAPPPLASTVPRSTAFLLRVEGGVATVLGEVRATALGETARPLRLEVNDGRLVGRYAGSVLIDVVDPAPLPPGQAGVYGYDTGNDGWGGETAFFNRVEAFRFDDDGDGVADDDDNCEQIANPDQADADGDRRGDACDDPPDDDEPVDESDLPPDTDTTPGGGGDGGGGDGGNGGGAGTDDTDAANTDPLDLSYDEALRVSCQGCDAGGVTGATGAAALLLALAARRRRR
jgi:uncharacterized protein (TIGR03382 family)